MVNSVLGIAATTKGVKVDIVLPEYNNHALVHWACVATLKPLVEKGVNIFLVRDLLTIQNCLS